MVYIKYSDMDVVWIDFKKQEKLVVKFFFFNYTLSNFNLYIKINKQLIQQLWKKSCLNLYFSLKKIK